MDKDEKIVACNDMPADVEMGSGNTEIISSSGLKRELGSRHINMIAVAGMIVSFFSALTLNIIDSL
jgi:yeast amino acid transporter